AVWGRGFGPKATPPPKRLGTPSVPTRARPVPFWRQALAVVKATSPRVRVEAVPRRRDAMSARAASCTSDWWNGSAKSASGRAALPEPPITGALLGIGTNLDDRVLGAGDGAFDQQQVAVGVDLGDFQAALGAALVAHLTRHPHPFEDAGGKGAGADRARGAGIVR